MPRRATENTRPIWITDGTGCRCTHWTSSSRDWEQWANEKLARHDERERKDGPGFVGGKLKQDGPRDKTNLEFRSVLALDIDKDGAQQLGSALQYLDGTALAVYSTHSHTESNPRYRVVVPLTRGVTAGEYEQLAQQVTSAIGGEFDASAARAAQLMYYPSCKPGAPRYAEVRPGHYLDPDTYLQGGALELVAPGSGVDVAAPVSGVPAPDKTLDDPRTKPGVIGAFCRVYDVPGAIDAYLQDVYAPSNQKDRYTYSAGESSNGLYLPEGGQWAYSHHGTDPAGGRYRNAFDLVRIHKFGHLDEGAKPQTPVNKLPSYLAMQRLANDDVEVRKELEQWQQEQAVAAFTVPGSDAEIPLEVDQRNKPKNTLSNFLAVIKADPAFLSVGWDLMLNRIGVRDGSALPWSRVGDTWNSTDLEQLRTYIAVNYQDLYDRKKLDTALASVAAERQFHPIVDWLESLPKWDGAERADTLLVDYLGAENTAYVRAVTAITLLAAVKRVYQPGCKFDYVLTLVGPQGLGKSTLFSKLGGGWFSDSLTFKDMNDKSAAEKLQRSWILEIAELADMSKAKAETIKAFITRVDDIYRKAYGTDAESHKRQNILVATTNAETGFLKDPTGGRRFWPVNTPGGAELSALELTDETIKQVWAEVLHRYNSGDRDLYLPKDLEEVARQAQRDAREVDAWEPAIIEYLDTPLPNGWYDKSHAARRDWFMVRSPADAFGSKEVGETRREEVTAVEIWNECFKRDLAEFDGRRAGKITKIMRSVDGWKQQRRRPRVKGYEGRQAACVFVRTDPPF